VSRSDGLKVPIIAITFYALTSDQELPLGVGCTPCQTKPVKADEFELLLFRTHFRLYEKSWSLTGQYGLFSIKSPPRAIDFAALMLGNGGVT